MVTSTLTQLPWCWGAAPYPDLSPQHGCQQLVTEVGGPAQLGPQSHLGRDPVQRGRGEYEVPPPRLPRPAGQQCHWYTVVVGVAACELTLRRCGQPAGRPPPCSCRGKQSAAPPCSLHLQGQWGTHAHRKGAGSRLGGTSTGQHGPFQHTNNTLGEYHDTPNVTVEF